MVGFVGIQARRRRRNRFVVFFFIIIIISLFFYLPSVNFSNENQNLPTEILPTAVIDETSLALEIEELKLEVFQKDQRIKFRDNQINKLRDEINNLNQSLLSIQKNYDLAIGDINTLENNSSENSEVNSKKINELNKIINEFKSKISNYEDKIYQLENELINSVSTDDLQNLSIENSILKNEVKELKKKNTESLEALDQLNTLIEEKDIIINQLNYLKDQQHHG